MTISEELVSRIVENVLKNMKPDEAAGTEKRLIQPEQSASRPVMSNVSPLNFDTVPAGHVYS